MPAEQWQSTSDHAPAEANVGRGSWQSTADHVDQPGVVSRFVQGTGIPATLGALTKGTKEAPTEWEGDKQFLSNAWDMVKQIRQTTKDHLDKADQAEKDGDYLSAIGHSLAAVPVFGELGSQIVQNTRDGNYAGALGGLATALGPKALSEAAPAIASGAETLAGKVPTAATAVKGFVKGAVPELPVVKQVLTGPIKAGIAEAKTALAANKPTYTPPTAAGKPGVTQVPAAAVQPVEYGAGGGHFGEEIPPPTPVAPVPARVPVWQGPPAEAAAPSTPSTPATFGDLMNPSQADLQAILDRNRAARNAATDARDPQGAPQVIARLKALSNEPQPAPATPPAPAPGTITIKQLASDPETFNRIARASMINDNLTAMASKLGYSAEDLQALKSQNPAAFDDLVSRISKTPLGTKNPTWWRDSAKPASPATKAVMDELPNSLKNNPKALAAAQALAEEMRKSQ